MINMKARYVLTLVLSCLSLAAQASAQTRVAVLVARFDTAPDPPSGTFEFIQSQFATVDSFYNKVPLSTDVHGIYIIPYSQDIAVTNPAIKQAAIDAGIDVPAKVYFVIDGGPPGPVNWGTFVVQWAAVAHEFRHHVLTPPYQGHEHGVVCDVNCVEQEYGNGFSVMGMGSGYFSDVLQAQFGWQTSPPEIIRSGDYCVEPLETPSAGGVKALRWHGGSGDTWPFALEYRQPTGFDAVLPWMYSPAVYAGVLFYRLSSNASGIDTTLLQVNPHIAGTLQDPSLHIGQKYCDVQGKLSITVLSADAIRSCVRFKFGGKC